MRIDLPIEEICGMDKNSKELECCRIQCNGNTAVEDNQSNRDASLDSSDDNECKSLIKQLIGKYSRTNIKTLVEGGVRAAMKLAQFHHSMSAIKCTLTM